jgi:hypothetical protein
MSYHRAATTKPPWRLFAIMAIATMESCSAPAKKPSEADIAAYLARSQPSYLTVGKASGSFEPATDLGGSKLPAGSWRIAVQFTLRAQQDLFAPTAHSLALRAQFDHAVSAAEGFRVARIEAVEGLARQAGLMQEGALAPATALAVDITTHRGQEVADHVTLLAQPDGQGWKFFQLDAQALSDDAIGTPLDTLRRDNPKTVFVLAGSDEDRTYEARERQMLDILAKAGKP